MAKYRKKPVVIEAIKFTGVESYIREMIPKFGLDFQALATCSIGGELIIETLEGDMKVDIGDWVIRGVKGEYYPCKPDIFEATYEKTEE